MTNAFLLAVAAVAMVMLIIHAAFVKRRTKP